MSGDNAAHCWHHTGLTLTSNPPQFPEVCCNCGTQRIRTTRAVTVPGHGPHAPFPVENREEVYLGGEGPCPGDLPGGQLQGGAR